MISPKHYIKLKLNTHVAHRADDVAIWVNTSLKKHTNKRVVNHVRKLYQYKLNKLAAYMKVKEKITNHEHLSHSLLMVHVCYIDGVFQSKFPSLFIYRTGQYYLIVCSQTKHLS